MTRATRRLARLADASLAWLALGAWVHFRAAAPELGAAELAAAFAASLALGAALPRVSGTSIGLWVYGVRSTEQGRFEHGRRPPWVAARAMLLTLAGFGAGSALVLARIAEDPRRRAFEPLTLTATLPDLTAGDWSIQPFYYSTGAWPRRFEGKPIAYTVPYEKGPPRLFVGRILAHWLPGQIVFTAEGPKTAYQVRDEAEASECLRKPALSQSSDCVRLRRGLLERHVEEMAALLPHGGLWTTQLFEVRVPGLEPREWTRGIYLELRESGSGDLTERGPPRAHARFILLTRKGQQQAFELSFPVTPEGLRARSAFRQGLTTQRMTDSLAPGRAWTEQKLGDWAPPAASPGGAVVPHLDRFTDLQSALVTRMSVDPARVDWYFHLAKSALFLSQYLAQAPIRDLSAGDSAALQKLLAGIPGDMLNFGRDVAGPGNADQGKIAQIEQFAIESSKLTK